jgi:hypothetical protein
MGGKTCLILGRYFALGSALTFGGALTALVSYFVAHIVVFAAIGIACVIVGLTSISLPEQALANEATNALLNGAALVLEPLLEEVRAKRAMTGKNRPGRVKEQDSSEVEGEEEAEEPPKRAKSIYLPPELDDARNTVKVYIPLIEEEQTTVDEMRGAPTKILPGDSQKGILVTTATAGLGLVREVRDENQDAESALQYVLVESSELCSSVKMSQLDDTIIAEMETVKVSSESAAYVELLGSLPTSIAATVLAIREKSPIILVDEKIAATKTIAQFRVLAKPKVQEQEREEDARDNAAQLV